MIKVDVIREKVVKPPIKEVTLHLSMEDAQALIAVAYGISGPIASYEKSLNSRGLLHVNVYPQAYDGSTEELRDKLRDIGNSISSAVRGA